MIPHLILSIEKKENFQILEVYLEYNIDTEI